MTDVTLTWDPVVGQTVEFSTGHAARYRMRTLDGLGPVGVPFTGSHIEGKTKAHTVKKKVNGKIVKHKVPGQPGHTVLDTPVSERIVVAQGLIQAVGMGDLWSARLDLASALAVEPVALGSQVTLGILKLVRGHGLPDLQLRAVPVGCTIPLLPGGSGVLPFDVEWHCPYPFWSTVTPDTVDVPTRNVSVDVTNEGDGASPPLILIYGPAVTVTVTNVTTGKAFRITGAIPAGQHVEVDCARKTVVLVNGAARSNWSAHLARGFQGFWPLVPGVNAIKWDRVSTTGVPDVTVTFASIYRGV